MNNELIIRSGSTSVDFALLKDGRLVELHRDKEDNKFSVGDIFIAKIRKTVSGLNAAFVNAFKDCGAHANDSCRLETTLLMFSCPGNHVMFCYCMENISQSGVKIVHGTLLIVHFVVTRFLKTI